MKKNLNAIIFGAAIIISSFFLAGAYLNKSKKEGTIAVTGLGKKDFTSDLIVWSGRFEAESGELKAAYSELKRQKKIILAYLESKGVSKDKMVFSAVGTKEIKKSAYSPDGEYIGQEFDGYKLSQQVMIESKEVEKIENISREVTELLDQGVKFYSAAPRYYFTKLADLKIEMIAKATEDARVRSESISKNSGSGLGQLVSAKMGIFQITGQNSNETYSWGGTYNTHSKAKTASITMKLVYKVK